MNLRVNLMLVYFDSCHLLGHKVFEDPSDTLKIMLVWLCNGHIPKIESIFGPWSSP